MKKPWLSRMRLCLNWWVCSKREVKDSVSWGVEICWVLMRVFRVEEGMRFSRSGDERFSAKDLSLRD